MKTKQNSRKSDARVNSAVDVMQNGLQLNPDKSGALGQRQLQSTDVKSVNVAGIRLTAADEMKVLSVVILGRRLTLSPVHTVAEK